MFDGFACGSPAMVPAGQRSIPSGATDIVVGVDIGSTTVKTVVVDAQTKRILDSQYARHGSRQALALREQLARVVDLFPSDVVRQARIFATGSGAAPLLAPLQARFVQEVNAAITAIDMLHPDVGSLVELGGQDAKIVVFKETAQPGERRAIASMNDKCASGTGATIDKCVAKLGLTNDALAALAWNPDKLHPVAAKCGVFAETDIVNLLKSGVPAEEIACSLLDAIVQQNLSVLTRGNTMRPRVLLLGGPNVYLPALRDCWRQRIAESWRERGIVADGPLDRLVFSPDHAQFYPALGAALFGLAEPGEATRFAGLAGLDAYLASGRRSDLQERAGPPLVASRAERDAFAARYATPPFEPARLQRGQTVEAFIGIDGGSTSSKAVLMDADGRVLQKAYLLSEGNPIADARTLTARLSGFVEGQGARVKVLGVGATGYAADILDETIGVDANVVETVAHMTSAVHYFGDVDVICDVGGQDIKVLFMANGQMKDFRLSNQCSAGNGALLQAMAAQFGVPIEDYAQTAFDAELTPKFSYGCAVFLDADRVTFQKEGFSREEIMAGLARVLPQNIWQYIVQIPRLSALGSKFVLQGGVQYNLAAVKAQVDYIGERAPEAAVHVHPHCGEAGAIGAALEARRVIARTPRHAVHRPACRRQHRLYDEERRQHRLPLLHQRMQAHLHRRAHARRPHQPLYRGLFLRERNRRIQGRAEEDRAPPQGAETALPQPRRGGSAARVSFLGREAVAGGGRRTAALCAVEAFRPYEDRRGAAVRALVRRRRRASQPPARRHSARPQSLFHRSDVADLFRDARPASGECRLLGPHQRGDGEGRAAARFGRSLFSRQDRTGARP